MKHTVCAEVNMQPNRYSHQVTLKIQKLII